MGDGQAKYEARRAADRVAHEKWEEQHGRREREQARSEAMQIALCDLLTGKARIRLERDQHTGGTLISLEPTP
mgnify:FL=1